MRTSGACVWGLVVGAITAAAPFFMLPLFVYVPTLLLVLVLVGLLGVSLCVMGLSATSASGIEYTGRGFAIAGLVLCGLGLVCAIVLGYWAVWV